MKKVKILAAILAAAMLLSGCSQESGSGNNQSGGNIQAAGNSSKVNTSDGKETSAEEADSKEETNAEPPVLEATGDFAYYEYLSKAYEKKWRKNRCIGISENGIVLIDGTIYYRTDPEKMEVHCYNIESGSERVINLNYTFGEGENELYYANQTFYIAQSGNNTIYRYDMNGELTGSVKIEGGFFRPTWLLDDGSLMACYQFNWSYSRISPDFTSFTLPPNGKIPNEFDYIKYMFIKDGVLYGFANDIDWEETQGPNAAADCRLLSYNDEEGKWLPCENPGLNLGDYYFYSEVTVNADDPENRYTEMRLNDGTGKYLALIKYNDDPEGYETFDINYKGGTSHIIFADQQWYRLQYPADGSEPDYSAMLPLGKDTRMVRDFECIRLDDTYYVYRDKEGYHLHTYQYGESKDILFYKR